MMLAITIFDAAGQVVSEVKTDAAMTSESEINEIIQLIKTGVPAWLAAQIVNSAVAAAAVPSQDGGRP